MSLRRGWRSERKSNITGKAEEEEEKWWKSSWKTHTEWMSGEVCLAVQQLHEIGTKRAGGENFHGKLRLINQYYYYKIKTQPLAWLTEWMRKFRKLSHFIRLIPIQFSAKKSVRVHINERFGRFLIFLFMLELFHSTFNLSRIQLMFVSLKYFLRFCDIMICLALLNFRNLCYVC